MDIHQIKAERRQAGAVPQHGFFEALHAIVEETRRSWLGGGALAAEKAGSPAMVSAVSAVITGVFPVITGVSLGSRLGRRTEGESGIDHQRLSRHHVGRFDQPHHD